ncbi:hypothetical protein FISHEDRAFT_37069 [Fistulina hepatica ATCC 64428]|uniref:Sulfhydryl oxidase n=1 Tax=Fistulina hepatica ATCC 64428 TaxID=1128425 RepID=A0A0D7AIQ5_9AGAR|nr:hypothetical protein FISHEDRAFT_37069 [Fistulina hepatica ATCC 64428]
MLSRFAKSFVVVIVVLLILATTLFLHPQTRSYFDPSTGEFFGEGGVESALNALPFSSHNIKGVHGEVIMPKLGNATAKAQLGRATWKLLHTMTLRYPENPTEDEKEALDSYIHLTSRLYPCGECASEFQQLLETYPPQTSSRRAASLWLCFVHNQVNARLHRQEFDCANLDEQYDCGCGDEPISGKKTSSETADHVEEIAQNNAKAAAKEVDSALRKGGGAVEKAANVAMVNGGR